MVLKKILESPSDCKEIKPVYPKGNQSWIFIGRTHAEAETPILWLHDAKSWLIWKDPDAGKDWRQEEKRTTKDDLVCMASPTQWTRVWVSSGSWWWKGGLACCSPCSRIDSDSTERPNWTELKQVDLKSSHKGFRGDPIIKNLPAHAGNTGLTPDLRSFHMSWGS